MAVAWNLIVRGMKHILLGKAKVRDALRLYVRVIKLLPPHEWSSGFLRKQNIFAMFYDVEYIYFSGLGKLTECLEKKVTKFRHCARRSLCSKLNHLYVKVSAHKEIFNPFYNSFKYFRWITYELIKQMVWKLKTKTRNCISHHEHSETGKVRNIFYWIYNERKRLVSS